VPGDTPKATDQPRTRSLKSLLAPHPVATTLLIVFGVIAVALAVATTFLAGQNWDLGMEVQASLNARGIDPTGLTLDQAYKLVNENLGPGPFYLESYGVLFWLMADGMHSLFGGSGNLSVTDTASLVWFGGLSIAVSALSAAALGFVVSRVLHSRWAGAVAASLWLSTPLWLGHTTMNFKDTTLAEGLCLTAVGLIYVSVAGERR
jgi:hypothetical protein